MNGRRKLDPGKRGEGKRVDGPHPNPKESINKGADEGGGDWFNSVKVSMKVRWSRKEFLLGGVEKEGVDIRKMKNSLTMRTVHVNDAKGEFLLRRGRATIKQGSVPVKKFG